MRFVVIIWGLFISVCFSQIDSYSDISEQQIKRSISTQPILHHMSRNSNRIALTFDDGPDELVTPKILKVLKEKDVKATFFLVGHMIAKYPHIVRMIHKDGHDIANHTWSHYRLDEMNHHQIADQIFSTEHLLTSINIPMAPMMRPPGGRYNNWVLNETGKQNLKMVMWDVNAADYMRHDGHMPSASDIIQKVLRKTKSGSIILMHNSSSTLEALPTLIDQLQKDYKIGLIEWDT